MLVTIVIIIAILAVFATGTLLLSLTKKPIPGIIGAFVIVFSWQPLFNLFYKFGSLTKHQGPLLIVEIIGGPLFILISFAIGVRVRKRRLGIGILSEIRQLFQVQKEPLEKTKVGSPMKKCVNKGRRWGQT